MRSFNLLRRCQVIDQHSLFEDVTNKNKNKNDHSLDLAWTFFELTIPIVFFLFWSAPRGHGPAERAATRANMHAQSLYKHGLAPPQAHGPLRHVDAAVGRASRGSHLTLWCPPGCKGPHTRPCQPQLSGCHSLRCGTLAESGE